MDYPLSWRELSYDLRLMYLCFGGIIATFPVAMVLFVYHGSWASASFAAAVATVLAATVIALSIRQYRVRHGPPRPAETT